MEIKVLLFGELAELAGSEKLLLNNIDSTSEAIELLRSTYPALASKKYAIALNKQLIKDTQPMINGDELALLPPFSGG